MVDEEDVDGMLRMAAYRAAEECVYDGHDPESEAERLANVVQGAFWASLAEHKATKDYTEDMQANEGQ
jgi:hypothetical protein